MAAKDGSRGVWCGESGDTEGRYSTFIASLFCESAVQKAERLKNTKVMVFVTAPTFSLGNDKMLNKNLATSFTSTLPSVLLQAVQMSSLSLDNI